MSIPRRRHRGTSIPTLLLLGQGYDPLLQVLSKHFYALSGLRVITFDPSLSQELALRSDDDTISLNSADICASDRVVAINRIFEFSPPLPSLRKRDRAFCVSQWNAACAALLQCIPGDVYNRQCGMMPFRFSEASKSDIARLRSHGAIVAPQIEVMNRSEMASLLERGVGLLCRINDRYSRVVSKSENALSHDFKFPLSAVLLSGRLRRVPYLDNAVVDVMSRHLNPLVRLCATISRTRLGTLYCIDDRKRTAVFSVAPTFDGFVLRQAVPTLVDSISSRLLGTC
jgi:hypothetical protein